MKNIGGLFAGALLLAFNLGCQSGGGTKSADAPAETTYKGFSVLQGVTGPTWTRINLVRNKNQGLKYVFSREDSQTVLLTNVKTLTHEYAGSGMVVDEIEVKGLEAGIIYRMGIFGADGKELDRRTFSSLEDKSSYNFAVVSCSDDFYKAEQKGMWTELLDKRPEFILAIGDNVYADLKNGQLAPITQGLDLWNRYLETRATLHIFRAEKLVPMAAIWDDHDFGVNDGDRRYPLKSESLKIFLSFFPQTQSEGNFVRGPGAASRWALGGQAFILLDNRSFRSPNLKSPACKAKPDHRLCQPRPDTLGEDVLAKKEPETHFGVEQERWAFAEVRKLRRPIWLVSGDQWFGAYHPFESYEGSHPNSFRKFVREMGKSAFRVAFISGDRHNSELTKVNKKFLGYESFEIVSSPIHARVFPTNWNDFPNKDQTFGTFEAMNYTMVHSNIDKQSWKTKTTNYKKDSVQSFNGESLIYLNK